MTYVMYGMGVWERDDKDEERVRERERERKNGVSVMRRR